MAEVARLKAEIPALEAEEKQLSRQLDEALAQIPNLPLDEVPDGKDENANVEHHHFGAKRNYGFAPQQHFDLGEALGQMDFETATKLSGARFVVLKSGLARLERALGQFMLDLHTGEHGYTEVNPPLLGARRHDVRHRPVAEVRRRSVFCDPNDCSGGTRLHDALKVCSR